MRRQLVVGNPACVAPRVQWCHELSCGGGDSGSVGERQIPAEASSNTLLLGLMISRERVISACYEVNSGSTRGTLSPAGGKHISRLLAGCRSPDCAVFVKCIVICAVFLWNSPPQSTFFGFLTLWHNFELILHPFDCTDFCQVCCNTGTLKRATPRHFSTTFQHSRSGRDLVEIRSRFSRDSVGN